MIDSKLVTFLSLCETQSYTKTAEKLYVTQPSVTNHIKTLEKLHNISIFKHNGKELVLTKEGKLLYLYAIKCQQVDNEFKHSLEGCKTPLEYLRFGVTPQIHSCFVSECIKKWVDKNPTDHVTLIVNNYLLLSKLISDSAIDFAIIDTNFNKKEFDSELLFTAKVHFVVGVGHPLALVKKASLESILSERFVFTTHDCGIKQLLSTEIRRRNLSSDSLNHSLFINDLSVIKAMVEDNLAVSMFYENDIIRELNDGSLISIEIPFFNTVKEIHAIFTKNHIEADHIRKHIMNLLKLRKEQRKRLNLIK